MLIDHADAFSNRPIAPFLVDFDAGRRISHSINIVPYGSLWRALRCNLTAGILHPSRLGLLAPLQRDAAEGVVGSLSARCAAGEVVVDLRDSLHTAVFTLAARLCFGDSVSVRRRQVCAMQDALREFFADLVEARDLAASKLARLLHWRRWQRFGSTFDRLIGLFLPLIAERQLRRSRCGDGSGGSIIRRPYVDSLLDLQVPDDAQDGARRALTDYEMASLVWEFLGAGTETVVSCVEWTLAHLAAQPDVQEKLHRELTAGDGAVASEAESLRELPYLRAVILDSLRLHPPVPFIVRDVTAEDAAVVIDVKAAAPPADGPVVRFVLMAGDIGRGWKAWTDHDEFRPERFLAGGEGEGVGLVPGPREMKMMPFGAGRRYCPGVGLGMKHVRCFVAVLVREFEWAPAPEGGGGVDLTELDGFFKVMKTPLRARTTRRTQRADS